MAYFKGILNTFINITDDKRIYGLTAKNIQDSKILEARNDITEETARRVLSVDYLNPIRVKDIPAEDLAILLVYITLDIGVKKSIRLLQQSLNLTCAVFKIDKHVEVTGELTDSDIEALTDVQPVTYNFIKHILYNLYLYKELHRIEVGDESSLLDTLEFINKDKLVII